MVPLWAIADEPARRLMLPFYRHLLGGESRIEALRKAQLELRESFPHPCHWASFVVLGYPGPLGSAPLADDARAAQAAQKDGASSASRPGAVWTYSRALGGLRWAS
jgi:hypothetical protein